MKRVLPIIFCMLLAACAPQNRQTTTSPDPTPTPSPDQQLANFLGTAVTGTSASFSGTTLGNSVTVTAKDVYVSALGELCREGVATTSHGLTRIAACREDETSPWQLAPAIFGKEAL